MQVLLAAALAAGVGTVAVVVLRGPSANHSDLPSLAPRATPVIMVHGYVPGNCPGVRATHDIWGGAYLALKHAGWTGPLLPATYYRCDTDGVDITGYGQTAPPGATTAVSAAAPRAAYTDDTSITRLAHDLAWFVYDTYTTRQMPVDLVGISMGGLIIRDALYRVAVHDRDFPPYLYVPRAVTFSTPHAGYLTRATNASFCKTRTVECDEFAADSPFMAELTAHAGDPQARGGTRWTLVGSTAGCDFMPAASALAMPAAERIDYASPCYNHGSYLWDLSSTDDARMRVYPPGSTAATDVSSAPRAMAWLAAELADAFTTTR